MRLYLTAILLLHSIFTSGQIPMPEFIGQPFPKFVAANEECKISNDSLLGKVVLINFWFEGCHPCLAEFEGLNEIAQILKENKDFEFISFTWDDAETVNRVRENYKLQFKVFSLDIKECNRLNLGSGYPKTMILDKQGKVKFIIGGGSRDSKTAKEYVMSTLLNEIQDELKL